jgi:hypothetical protein
LTFNVNACAVLIVISEGPMTDRLCFFH